MFFHVDILHLFSLNSFFNREHHLSYISLICNCEHNPQITTSSAFVANPNNLFLFRHENFWKTLTLPSNCHFTFMLYFNYYCTILASFLKIHTVMLKPPCHTVQILRFYLPTNDAADSKLHSNTQQFQVKIKYSRVNKWRTFDKMDCNLSVLIPPKYEKINHSF